MDISDYLKESNQTQIEFAKTLGVSQPMVGFWIHGKPPTIERAIQIEKLTHGAVTCEELRPDLAEQLAYLRGTKKAAAEGMSSILSQTVVPAAKESDSSDDWGSGDPRHGQRRKPEQRSGKDRRVGETVQN